MPIKSSPNPFAGLPSLLSRISITYSQHQCHRAILRRCPYYSGLSAANPPLGCTFLETIATQKHALTTHKDYAPYQLSLQILHLILDILLLDVYELQLPLQLLQPSVQIFFLLFFLLL